MQLILEEGFFCNPKDSVLNAFINIKWVHQYATIYFLLLFHYMFRLHAKKKKVLNAVTASATAASQCDARISSLL
jgi:hypothetical protein